MGRRSRPWRWAERNGWYATVHGKRRLLARGGPEAEPAARRELHRILSLEPEADPAPPAGDAPPEVGELIQRFLDHAAAGLKPITMELYRRRLVDFGARWGKLDGSSVRPRHVNEWLDSHAWGPGTRRTAIIIVRRAFSWAARQGYLPSDPTAGVEKPPEGRREYVPTQGCIDAVISAIKAPRFREFFRAIALTGCRPGEAAKVEARHFDPRAATWTMEGKTTRKTKRMRVVYLPDSVAESCRALALEHPSGPLFRNTRGDPWTIQAYGKQLRRARRRAGVGPDVVTYGLRHLWITDALERGVPIATVAELAGHSSTAMIEKTYSHLSERSSHLREALRKIRPED
jgi:integrase/recombinase XerC